jgi:hypothetical protein
MYDLAVICAVGFAAWQGSQAGALAGGLIGMEMIVSVTVGLLFHELLAGFLGDGLRLALEPFLSPDFPYQGIAVPLAFAALTWGTFAGLRFRFHKGAFAAVDDEGSLKPSTVERVAGGLVGGCSGVVIVGAVLLTLSMIPLPAGLRLDPQRMYFDAGGLVLRMAGEFEPDRHEGVSLVVHGEPASRSSDPSAKLVSEPRVAGPDEGSPDEGARFSDVDGNGSFTEDLYFLDLDADQVRRVGLRDKYVVGVWSGALDAHARPRPKPAGASQDSPAPAPPADPADSEAVSPAPAKPARPGTKPATKPGKAPPPVDDF